MSQVNQVNRCMYAMSAKSQTAEMVSQDGETKCAVQGCKTTVYMWSLDKWVDVQEMVSKSFELALNYAEYQAGLVDKTDYMRRWNELGK